MRPSLEDVYLDLVGGQGDAEQIEEAEEAAP